MLTRLPLLTLLILCACSADRESHSDHVAADLILTNARVYTLTWPDPRPDGNSAPTAPWKNGWQPDAEAIAIRQGIITFVGTHKQAAAWRGEHTRSLDLQGATVIPGLVAHAIPAADLAASVQHMVAGGYVAVNLVGVSGQQLQLLQSMQQGDRLPLRVNAMPVLPDQSSAAGWIESGPVLDKDSLLTTTGFQLSSATDLAAVADIAAVLMRAGFQFSVSLEREQDAAASLAFFQNTIAKPGVGSGRHRLEHSQRLSLPQVEQLAALRLLAAVDPPVDAAPGLFARQLRSSGVLLLVNSARPEIAGSIFRELYALVTRQADRGWSGRGWSPHQRLSMDEALRAYTRWPAFANFQEKHSGVIKVKRRADLTVMDVDPFHLAETDPEGLLAGQILMTVVQGEVRYQR